MTRLLLTHTDLDGAACAVMALGTLGITFELVENGAIDARVEVAIGRGQPDILVADHGLREDTARLVDGFVDGGGKFTLLDHHRSSLDLAARPWATVDETRSAAGLLFDHLGRPARFEEFARLVEDHDLWRHEDPRSARLAALVGLLGHERFLARFSADPKVEFTEAEQLLLDHAEGQREDYLRRKVPQAWQVELAGARWAICFAEQYQSDLAERLMTELGVAATAIVNPGKRTVSLRGRGVDVSIVAQRHGGGGHARAAAFSFAGDPLEVDLARFQGALEVSLTSSGDAPAQGRSEKPN